MTNQELAREIVKHVLANKHSNHLEFDITRIIDEEYPASKPAEPEPLYVVQLPEPPS